MREWNWQPFDYVGISFENAVYARERVLLFILQLNRNFQGTGYYDVVSWSLINTVDSVWLVFKKSAVWKTGCLSTLTEKEITCTFSVY